MGENGENITIEKLHKKVAKTEKKIGIMRSQKRNINKRLRRSPFWEAKGNC